MRRWNAASVDTFSELVIVLTIFVLFQLAVICGNFISPVLRRRRQEYPLRNDFPELLNAHPRR